MKKVNSGYILLDPRKFDSIEITNKEVERIAKLCYRLKNKHKEDDISFIVGGSNINGKMAGKGNIGRMGYSKPKNKGGKKEFIHEMLVINNKGERVKAPVEVEPHIHILVEGYGASSRAEDILNNLRKRDPNTIFRKTKLPTRSDIVRVTEYIEDQSYILRRI